MKTSTANKNFQFYKAAHACDPSFLGKRLGESLVQATGPGVGEKLGTPTYTPIPRPLNRSSWV
jgi:hypothetical protein